MTTRRTRERPAEPESTWNTRILVVDDQPEIHDDFRDMLVPELTSLAADKFMALPGLPRSRPVLPAFDLLDATSGEAACELVAQARGSDRPVAVAYVDIRMPPGIDGIETVRRIRAVDRDIEVVIMTAYTDKALSDIVGDMDLLHKLLYVRKPFAPEEIQQMTLSLVAKWNVEHERDVDRRRLEAVLNATGDAMALYDGAGGLLFANGWYERLFDAPAAELRKLPQAAAAARFKERVREPDPADSARAAQVPPRHGAARLVESRADADGERRLFHRSTLPVRDGEGGVTGSLVVYRDLSREIETERMKREVERLRSELATTCSIRGVVGASAAMREVCALVERVAESDVGVLVTGESGTGKELIARALHYGSSRRDRPFLAANLAAVPEALVESELFGHERGAYTGAEKQRIGYFEQAQGGTLLLDEIGDMPLALQPKLLRVLQERTIRRVGGTTDVPIDVRVVAATNQDLRAAIRGHTFREDLYYRVAVFPIAVPPLRTRVEDIPLLAEHFLKKHAARSAQPVRRISPAALRRLEHYAWPGNVRELENVICRALVLETTDALRAGNLPPELSAAPTARPRSAGPPGGVTPLAEVERRAIIEAFETADRNTARAARLLGIDRTTLYRKLKSYGRLDPA